MSGCARVSRHIHRSPYHSVNLEVPGGESLGVEQRSRVLGGCAPVLARNHADQPFGGGLSDSPRAIIPSAYERRAGRITFDSVDCGDDRGSDDGVVTRGLAAE